MTGVVTTNKKKVTLTGIEVWEYGFSKAVWELCPKGWKDPLGDDWADVLRIIISDWSPRSYLSREGLREKGSFRYQFNAQAASLSRRIYKEYNLDVKDLDDLKTIYLLCMEEGEVISKISPGQQMLIDSLGLGMEV